MMTIGRGGHTAAASSASDFVGVRREARLPAEAMKASVFPAVRL